VRRAFSPPFDFTLEEFVKTPKCNLYLGPEAEFIKSQKLIWRSILSTIATLKRRHIDAPKIDLWIDETVLLAPFPLIGDLVNFAPGYGLRAIIVTQTLRQLDQLFQHGREVITGGVAVQIYLGINEISSARLLSETLGSQSVYFDDELAHDRAELEARRAVNKMLSGDDPFMAGVEQKHFAKATRHRSQQTRRLMNADEIINMPKGEGFIFANGMEHPIYAEFPPYFEQRRLAGKFLPSPFFPPHDRIRVKTLFGHKWRPVHRGPPPTQFRDYPQYQNHDHLWVGK
jgi:type IV secretion system protein VirD4